MSSLQADKHIHISNNMSGVVKAKRKLTFSPKKNSLGAMQKLLHESPNKEEFKVEFSKKADPLTMAVRLAKAAKNASARFNWATADLEEMDAVKAKDKDLVADSLTELAQRIRGQSLSDSRQMLRRLTMGDVRQMRACKAGPMKHNGMYPVVDIDISDEELNERVMLYAAATDISPDQIRADPAVMANLRAEADAKALRSVNPQTIIHLELLDM